MMHQGSKETYEYIANWISPDFFFSKNDVWHRFGILGAFGDYILSCTPGDILEIGVGESSIYLTALAKKYGRKVFHCDASPGKITNPATIPGYLMAGGLLVMNEEVDAAEIAKFPAIFFAGDSDNFFKKVPFPPIALAFIDGDHHCDQARKDFWNTVPFIVPNGYILLHDTYPPNKDYLSPDSACGDVYRLRQEIERIPEFDCLTLPRGTAMSVGLTIVRKKPTALEFFNE